jgi:hypothetical protein
VALIGVGQGMGVRQQKLVDAISVTVVEQDEPKQQQKVCLKLLEMLFTSASGASLCVYTRIFKLSVTIIILMDEWLNVIACLNKEPFCT